MQRSCDDQGRPGVCLSMHLSVVGWTWTKYFGQGNNFLWWSKEIWNTSRKGGGTMQTQREQTSRSYTVQSAHGRWYGITRVHRKVQASSWCMRMARKHEGHGTQERYSPRSKESKSLSKVIGRRPGLSYRRTSDWNCNSLVPQRLWKINYADSQWLQQQLQYSEDQHRFTKCKQSIKKVGNQQSGQIKTWHVKIKSMVRQKDKVVFVVEQNLLTPDRSVRPRMLLDTSVERKDITKSAARAKQVNKVQLVKLGRFKYMVYKHCWQESVPIRLQFVILHRTTTWCSVYSTCTTGQPTHNVSPHPNFSCEEINDTSSKHIKPLWLSTASGGPIYQVECEIDTKPGGSIWLCLDPKYLNKSIKRNQYYTKTINEVSAELHRGKYFMLVGAKSGYWMVELYKESSLLQHSMPSHQGIWRSRTQRLRLSNRWKHQRTRKLCRVSREWSIIWSAT